MGWLFTRVKLYPWLGFFSAISFIILLSLGIWQIERLNRKLDIINQIETRLSLPPVIFASNYTEVPEFTPVIAKGVFLHDHEIHLAAKHYKGKLGFHIITPMRTNNTTKLLLINRGWVPVENKDQSTRTETLIKDEVTIEGIIRSPDRKNMFTADNNPEKNYWFWLDMDLISKNLNAQVYHMILNEIENGNDSIPIGMNRNIEIRNDHLGYAITWFSLALSLATIYFVYIFKK